MDLLAFFLGVVCFMVGLLSYGISEPPGPVDNTIQIIAMLLGGIILFWAILKMRRRFRSPEHPETTKSNKLGQFLTLVALGFVWLNFAYLFCMLWLALFFDYDFRAKAGLQHWLLLGFLFLMLILVPIKILRCSRRPKLVSDK
jgi:biotin transporter BioY